jgi:NitT/TauT family transport system substrate-binding protein
MPLSFTRREWLLAAGVWPAALGLGACSGDAAPLLRVGLHTWPGYELLYLARELGRLDEKRVRLVHGPSGGTTIRALALKTLEAGCLTLDEVLSARDRGIPLTVLAVFNDSQGADAVLGRHPLRQLSDLPGARVGVEKSAVGAVMLDAALRAAGLKPHHVNTVYLAADEHVKAFKAGRIDALVTYEPHKTQLLNGGAVELYSTRQAPGLIVDVLAVRTEVWPTFRRSLQELLDAQFHAVAAWKAQPRKYDAFLAQRLQIDPRDVPAAFAELKIPTREENLALMQGPDAPMRASAMRLAASMHEAGLLRQPADLTGLFAVDAL